MFAKIIDVLLKEQKTIKLDGINLKKKEINVIGSIIAKKEELAEVIDAMINKYYF
jgi:deoxyhypusine synthase